MFTFFLQVNRTGLITFCGSNIEERNKIVFSPEGEDGKYCFRKFENGQYKEGVPIITRHPNILKSVLIGKKGWGLWRDQWTDGIVEWSFTREEILNEFFDKNIEIPESFLKEFDDFIEKKKEIRNKNYSEFLGSGGMWK